jgi:carbon-monoxide dehydrogenase medium subunit
MRLPDFSYHRPTSVSQACALAASLGDGTRFLAGGTELLPELKKGRAEARHLVSLTSIPALRRIRVEDGLLRIGALASLETVASSRVVREAFPVLAEAAGTIGCVQIREQGTIGGNFCGAVPCADTPPACLVGGGRVKIVGPGGERALPAEEFFLGPRETVLGTGDVLVEVLVPVPTDGFGAAYERFGLRRGMAVAVASVAAGIVLENETITSARIALGAVAPVPLLASAAAAELIDRPATDETFERAAIAAAAEARPICDVRGSDEYRREIVSVLARRALERAAARAREDRP